MRTLQNRIMERTQPHEDGSTCIQWTGTFSKRNRQGNPVIVVGNKTKQVRRLLYEMFNEPLPASSLFVLTRCGKNDCVHPDHLYLAQAAHAPAGLVPGRRMNKGERPAEYDPNDTSNMITAAGQTKTLEKWLDDPLVTVSRATLKARIRDKKIRDAARAEGRDSGPNEVTPSTWDTWEKLLFTPAHKRATKAEMYERTKAKPPEPPMTRLAFIARRARVEAGEEVAMPEAGLFDSLTKGE